MNVFHFGTGARRLFGLYLPPRSQLQRGRAAVLCAPWGQEYLKAHRSMRQLGAQLSASGFHVLRFDYYGTGDSAGDMMDASVADWEQDIVFAMEELRDISGVERVSLVGLRLGSTLAARVAAARPSAVSELVLWDAIISGEDYLREMTESAACTIAHNGGAPHRTVRGFPLTQRFADELARLDLASVVTSLPARTMLLTSFRSRAEAERELAFHKALVQHSPTCTVEVVEALPAWVEYGNTGVARIPATVLDRIVQWLR
jgi:pimeloyl-ACP methyl ester carboxylesterase